MIKIIWSEIKEDVDKQTWRIAKVRIKDAELASDAQEDSSVSSLRYILRFAEEGIAMVATAIREQMVHTSTALSTDALDDSKQYWTFTLKGGSAANEDALAMLIHMFVVRYILFRWMQAWSPDEANSYYKQYVDTLSQIVEEAFSFGWPTKVKPEKIEEIDEIEVSYS